MKGYAELWQREAVTQEHNEDEASDRVRFGGPVTDGMIMTLLQANWKRPGSLRWSDVDVKAVAQTINSWLHPVKE